MSDNIAKRISYRPYSASNTNCATLYSAVKGNRNIIQRMKLLNKLPVHNGCVNTISWNDTGEYILSGSDDQRLCISNAYTNKLETTIRTGHRANIFSAKFLPCSSDEKIVSCSGDGIIMFTNVARVEETMGNSFNCHFGTAYKIITVPNDPHSFLSCGEDGTVRWYDLRIKQSCHLEDCREDILINCRRAVTALAVNPLIPYQLAIGCSDSYVQIFDRRMMGTKATGGAGGGTTVPLVRFTVPGFENHSHRITSLVYSARADEVLVSYSSEYLYLFKLQNSEQPSNLSGGKEFGFAKKKNNAGPLPMKRLRLRGDWSDTGPNARPEREMNDTSQRPSLHTSLMQRMSDVLTRMLNDPSRARSPRNQPSAAASEPSSSSQEAPTTETPTSTVDGPTSGSTSPVFTDSEESRFSEASQQAAAPPVDEVVVNVLPLADFLSSPETEEADAPTGAANSASESFVSVSSLSDSNHCDNNRQSVAEEMVGPASTTSASGNDNVMYIATSQDEQLLEVNEEPRSSVERSVENKDKQSLCSSSSSFLGKEASQDEGVQARPVERHNVEPAIIDLRHGGGVVSTGLDRTDGAADPGAVANGNAEKTGASTSDDAGSSARRTFPDACGDAGGSLDSFPAGRDRRRSELEVMVLEESQQSNERVSSASMPEDRPPTSVATSQDESGGASSSVRARTPTSESSILPDVSSDSSSGEEELTRCWFRRNSGLYPPKSELSGDLIRNMDEAVSGSLGGADGNGNGNATSSDRCILCLPPPQLLHKFTGHRNARTMIKEANFWGEDFVISGSDCGHIFFWDRYSGEVVMILEADRHVVNCIQPHPYDPVLASSGIDYDIKLWAPLEEEPNFNRLSASEIILRNDVMLEETRDTITVPASFMIRMLASLNHLRSGARSRLARSQSSQDN